MGKCWQTRECDEEMQSGCMHPNELDDQCPTKCAFAQCDRPQHKLTTDPALVFDPYVDREMAVKGVCTFCEFFLTHGPRIAK